MWDLPDAGIEPASPELTGGFFTTEPQGKPLTSFYFVSLRRSTGLSSDPQEQRPFKAVSPNGRLIGKIEYYVSFIRIKDLI